MADHEHQWGNTQKFSRHLEWLLSETCGCGAFSTIEFPPDAPPVRNVWPESAHRGVAGWTTPVALTDTEEARYQAILGLDPGDGTVQT